MKQFLIDLLGQVCEDHELFKREASLNLATKLKVIQQSNDMIQDLESQIREKQLKEAKEEESRQRLLHKSGQDAQLRRIDTQIKEFENLSIETEEDDQQEMKHKYSGANTELGMIFYKLSQARFDENDKNELRDIEAMIQELPKEIIYGMVEETASEV